MRPEHAPIAPSSLDLTVKCPGSVKLQASVPVLPDTEDEAEGKAAYWIAMMYASNRGSALPAGTKFSMDNRVWTVDDDMVSGARHYVQALGEWHGDLRLEDPVDCKRVHPTVCWGTPDAWRFFPDARQAHATCPPEISPDMFAAGKIKILRVGGYKYGHRYVEPFGNYQLSAFASGVMDRLQLNDLDPDLWLELFIIQPRCYQAEGPVRVWRIQASTLRTYINIASNAAHTALGDNPPTYSNNSCIDCRARHVCKTLQLATHSYIDFAGSAEIIELSADAVGTELAMLQDAIRRLEARETGLTAQAEIHMRNGKAVSFFHMEPGQSRLTYLDDVNVDEMLGLGDLLNINLRKTLTKKDLLITPTQAQQRGIDEATMKHYAFRPNAALKLARDNSVTARKVFSK